MTAPINGVPTRDKALLIADPRPAWRLGIELINVLVSGATTSEIPMPNRTRAGRTSMKIDAGGRNVEGLSSATVQGAEVVGIRAHHNIAAAMIRGPITRNGFAPIRPAQPPTGRESATRSSPVGKPTSDTPIAVYPRVPWRSTD